MNNNQWTSKTTRTINLVISLTEIFLLDEIQAVQWLARGTVAVYLKGRKDPVWVKGEENVEKFYKSWERLGA
jgi:hypothetical protein